MKLYISLAASIVASLMIVAACARTDIAQRESTAAAETHLKPDRVVVYDFASDPADLPPGSALAKLYEHRASPLSEEEIALGRQLGELTTMYLVDALNKNHVPAINGSTGAVLRLGDGVIRGTFVTIDEGSATKRMLIGFGSGAAKLKALVEGYEVTKTGLTPLGSATVETAGGKMPGILVPVGIGAAAGTAGGAAAVSGTSNILQEMGAESLDGAAKRIADEIAAIVVAAWRERDWL